MRKEATYSLQNKCREFAILELLYRLPLGSLCSNSTIRKLSAAPPSSVIRTHIQPHVRRFRQRTGLRNYYTALAEQEAEKLYYRACPAQSRRCTICQRTDTVRSCIRKRTASMPDALCVFRATGTAAAPLGHCKILYTFPRVAKFPSAFAVPFQHTARTRAVPPNKTAWNYT